MDEETGVAAQAQVQAQSQAKTTPTSWDEIMQAARPLIGRYCHACPVCDGRACGNQIPGPGAKGSGDGARRNYEAWRDVRLNMDALVAGDSADTGLGLFDRTLSLPVMVGPVGDVNRHYGPSIDTLAYNRMSLAAAREAGTVAFTGDGIPNELMDQSCAAIAENDGWGVPTVKPWSLEKIATRFETARSCRPFAIAMDVDAAGLPFLKGQVPPAGPKSPEDLAEIVRMAQAPFIVKGVMTVAGARKAAQAGAAAIVVSNHGGRVLDGCPATAEVLPGIAAAIHEEFPQVKVFVDGGIRSGVDVFRALALGADATLICRPFVPAAYGAGQAGIAFLLERLRGELEDAMIMCGARKLADINPSMVSVLPR